MERAYSLFAIKSIDEEKRLITGIATTPGVDRVGDIVEPEGADYKLPMPFLFQHDASQPIGNVTRAKVAKSGIVVEIQLAKPDEPGPVKDRVDAAWQDIKLGLVRGLSIGFKSIEAARNEDTGGRRFLKWSWIELSAVTIPANADASITTVKAAALSWKQAPRWSVGAARDLPLSASNAWDGGAAAGRMLDAADIGGDSANPQVARRGFLIYDAAHPELRGSYKLPFADLRGGRLEAVAAGLRASASRLPQTDAPQDVLDRARGVLDAYFARINSNQNALPAGPVSPSPAPAPSPAPTHPMSPFAIGLKHR